MPVLTSPDVLPEAMRYITKVLLPKEVQHRSLNCTESSPQADSKEHFRAASNLNPAISQARSS